MKSIISEHFHLYSTHLMSLCSFLITSNRYYMIPCEKTYLINMALKFCEETFPGFVVINYRLHHGYHHAVSAQERAKQSHSAVWCQQKGGRFLFST